MKPKVPIDLDGAIKRAASSKRSRRAGDDDPALEIVKSPGPRGLEGRKTTSMWAAPVLRIESVVARDGQVVYQIQIF